MSRYFPTLRLQLKEQLVRLHSQLWELLNIQPSPDEDYTLSSSYLQYIRDRGHQFALHLRVTPKDDHKADVRLTGVFKYDRKANSTGRDPYKFINNAVTIIPNMDAKLAEILFGDGKNPKGLVHLADDAVGLLRDLRMSMESFQAQLERDDLDRDELREVVKGTLEDLNSRIASMYDDPTARR